MMRILMCVLVMYSCNEAFALVAPIDIAALAGAEHDTAQRQVYTAAKEYLAKHSSLEETANWQKRWEQKVSGADSPDEGEEKFTVRTFQTFVADNRSIFSEPDEAPKKKVIEACRLFCQCIDRGYVIPARIADKMTADSVKIFLAFLKD